ncbi:MAG: hypothetical protein IJB27_01405, partial [Clostridia bacterium]|nr:hypothetical protein [Clostridia bacterium]
MKRGVTIGICALLMALMLCGTMTAFARAEVVNFALSVNDAKVGETATVSVSLPADSYFTNTTMHLHYDSTAVSFIEEDVGEISPRSAMFMVNDKPEENMVSAAYVTINGIKKGGVLVTFAFEVLKETPVEFSLTFNECVGVDENDVEFDVNYVTQSCILNNDGSLTTAPASKPTTTTPTANDPTTPIADATTTSGGQADPSVTDAPVTEPTAPSDAVEQKEPIYSTVTDAAGAPVTEADGTVVTTMVYVDAENDGTADMTALYIVL